MATLSESATWTSGIYQIERADKWDGGISGSGLANNQGKGLANRTLYLKTEIEKRWNREKFQILYTDQTVPQNTAIYAKGTGYTLLSPLGDWDYTTPNDAITRDYIVSVGCLVGTAFTYSTSASVSLLLITSTAGPTEVELLRCTSFQPGVSIMAERKITLGPNVRVAGLLSIGAIGASVLISQGFFRLEEVIK